MARNLVFPFVLLLAVSCGSDAVVLSSGLEGTTALSDLNASQVAELCGASASASERLLDDHRRGVCVFLAALSVSIGGEVPRQECEDAIARCLEQPPTKLDTTACTLRSTECAATVAELETCLQDQLNGAVNLYGQMAKLSCDDILAKSPALEQIMEDPTSAACLALRGTCTNVDEEFVGPWE